MNKIIKYSLLGLCVFLLTAFILMPNSNFPRSSGQYGVGKTSYHWIDTARKDLNSQDPEHPNRELMAYVFYPTNKSGAQISYDSDAAERSIEFLSNTTKLPRFVFSSIKSIKTYSQPDATIIQSPTSFPVIIFSHGGGPVVQQYTYLFEELASHGFIVIGINHPYVSALVRYPDGHIVKSMYREKTRDATGKTELLELDAQDVSFVINKIEELIATKDDFWSHADLNKIGVMGHSYGGRTATKAIRQDPRIKCGINMDGGAQNEDLTEPFPNPFLFMIAEKSFLYNENFPAYATETKPFLDTIHRFAETENFNTKVIAIKDVGHTVFLDTPLQLNSTLIMRLVSRIKPDLLNASARKASAVLVNDVLPNIIKFFDEKLNIKHKINEVQVAEIVKNALSISGDVAVKQLKGGLSGAKLFVADDRIKKYVVRFLTHKNPEKREVEINSLKIASERGYGPHIYFVNEDGSVIIMEYLQTQPITLEQRKSKELYMMLGQLLRKIHSGPDLSKTLDVFSPQRLHYIQGSYKDIIPGSILETMDKKLAEIHRIVEPYIIAAPCHTDLNPNNLIFTGTDFKAIDYETAAQADPYYDVATVAIWYTHFSAASENILLTAYLGHEPTPKEKARLYLMKQVAFMSYAVIFLKLAEQRKQLYETLEVPSYLDFVRTMSGLEKPETQLKFAKVIINQLMINFESQEFKDAVDVLREKVE